MPGPLEGSKVLDLTRLAPGPFCTMILGDFGANITRIQEPGLPTGSIISPAPCTRFR